MAVVAGFFGACACWFHQCSPGRRALGCRRLLAAVPGWPATLAGVVPRAAAVADVGAEGGVGDGGAVLVGEAFQIAATLICGSAASAAPGPGCSACPPVNCSALPRQSPGASRHARMILVRPACGLTAAAAAGARAWPGKRRILVTVCISRMRFAAWPGRQGRECDARRPARVIHRHRCERWSRHCR